MKRMLLVALVTVMMLTLASSGSAFAHSDGHSGGPGLGAPPAAEDAILFVCEEASVAVEATGTDECDAA